jgi:hypothetical protein
MADYQLTASEEPCAVIRTEDGACIPPDEANRDYAEYLDWKADGNEPDPYEPPPEPEPAPPSPEQLLLFDHENRIRAQEGSPPLTVDDFLGKLDQT